MKDSAGAKTHTTSFDIVFEPSVGKIPTLVRRNPMPMHMGLDELIEISEKYPNCKFYAIHRSDYEVPQDKKVFFPKDGDIIEL